MKVEGHTSDAYEKLWCSSKDRSSCILVRYFSGDLAFNFWLV
jgi:hypothetical protein